MRPPGRLLVDSFLAAAAALAMAGCGQKAPAAASAETASGQNASEWLDATATLDPKTTPVYEGDAPMKFDFLKDMRKGDAFTLSVYA
ncbi:MAG: hypothetical protein ACJ77R_08935, partial [Gemmatimonadaceae bacterium]